MWERKQRRLLANKRPKYYVLMAHGSTPFCVDWFVRISRRFLFQAQINIYYREHLMTTDGGSSATNAGARDRYSNPAECTHTPRIPFYEIISIFNDTYSFFFSSGVNTNSNK